MNGSAGSARGAMLVCAIMVACFHTGLWAQTPVVNDAGKPSVSPSLVDANDPDAENKPFFRKIDAAFNAARRDDITDFTRLLAPNTKATLVVWADTSRRTVPITTELAKMIVTSCFGPYPIAEGTYWTQFSFVCRTDPDSPLNKFIRFENSPELSMTAIFSNGRIATLDAGEVIMMPGRRIVSMDAYENAKKN